MNLEVASWALLTKNDDWTGFDSWVESYELFLVYLCCARAVVVAKRSDQQSHNPEVPSSNPPGARAFFLCLSTAECH